MGTKSSNKRPSSSAQVPSKKRKLSSSKPSKNGKSKEPKGKGKDHAYDRLMIPIPGQDDEYEAELSDQDLELLEEYGPAVGFLGSLDAKGIARSKKEQDRLHRLTKPAPAKRPAEDDLPSINSNSGDEEEDDWSSAIDADDDLATVDSALSDDDVDPEPSARKPRARPRDSDFDVEMSYETLPRKRRPSWDDEGEKKAIDRLPIKLADGRIQKHGEQIVIREKEVEESEDEEEEPTPAKSWSKREDISTGARFGRASVTDVLQTKSRKARVQAAKEQIAGICHEIIGDPEDSLGLLRRLHTFSLPEVSTATHPEPVANDPMIRKLAILSQLSVFKDVLPGYRIRALTDKEKAEKVSQMVARTREWEQGLVGVYQSYLRSLDAELKANSELADVALRCMCTLLVDVTHFNFRENLATAIVARLSKKSWDESSDLCLNAIVSVFRNDETGVASLELVRLLNRMVKERRFNIHPNVLSCLLHLRLKSELGVRSSQDKAEKEETAPAKGKGGKKGKDKPQQPHLSKKAKKVLKERKEIEKEMKEAEAEVDKEERSSHQTETLKLLFVLYFRIMKNPSPTPLLPVALQGISRFAHLVSIDFFKDLMKVLKELIVRESAGADEEVAVPSQSHAVSRGNDMRLRLQCIVTAFELLSGQGEALNIDLSDFMTQLYSIILSSALLPDIEEAPAPTASYTSSASSASASKDARSVNKPQGAKAQKSTSTSDLLFRSLQLAFSPRTSGGPIPPWRSAAFAKRLLTASLHWPAPTALRTLEFVRTLLVRDPKLEALLSTEDRTVDGVYRPDLEDPQLCNPFGTSFWELGLLGRCHVNERVREQAEKLARFEKV